jgi:hypothetical protein
MKTSGRKHIPWRNMANILRLVSRRNLFNFNNISCRELYSYQTIYQKSSVGVEFKDAETISNLKADKKHGLDLTFIKLFLLFSTEIFSTENRDVAYVQYRDVLIPL